MKKISFCLMSVLFTSLVHSQINMNSSGVVTFSKGFNFGNTTNYAASDMRIQSTSMGYPSITLIKTSGYVGINVGPNSVSYPLDCRGTVAGYSFHTYSDARVKKNIEDIDKEQIWNILNLIPKEYDLDSTGSYIHPLDNALTHKHFGLIAQDVKKIYPQIVSETDDGLMSINYIELIPLLIGVIKEQQKVIDDLSADIEVLKSNNVKKSSDGNSFESVIENNKSWLGQNLPNPFSENTMIEYFLKEYIEDAKLYIYNMNGTQLKNYDLHLKGNGNITINAGELNPGMYMYTLITDGKVIDTKRMILTD